MHGVKSDYQCVGEKSFEGIVAEKQSGVVFVLCSHLMFPASKDHCCKCGSYFVLRFIYLFFKILRFMGW